MRTFAGLLAAVVSTALTLAAAAPANASTAITAQVGTATWLIVTGDTVNNSLRLYRPSPVQAAVGPRTIIYDRKQFDADGGKPVIAGPGCKRGDVNVGGRYFQGADCPATPTVVVNADAGNDLIDIETGTTGSARTIAAAMIGFGQAGTDELRGGDNNDTLFGGAGSDTLLGRGGADRLTTNDDGTDVDTKVDCGAPSLPTNGWLFDYGTAPANEDWADVSAADSDKMVRCENVGITVPETAPPLEPLPV